MSKDHIATAAAYGITGRRIGIRYLYSEDEVEAYVAELREHGKRPYLRRRDPTPADMKGA